MAEGSFEDDLKQGWHVRFGREGNEIRRTWYNEGKKGRAPDTEEPPQKGEEEEYPEDEE